MKKSSKLLIGLGFILVAGTIGVSASLAWFHPTTSVGNNGETNTMPIDGSSSSGYFAYGDGSEEKPYGIRTPRHLYNLAWLQYMGYFNNKQLHFELADNVNMSGWTLPPIGSEDNPFISIFNGNGYVVSNLTVSNNFSEYNVHPSIVTGFNTSNYKQPHILGMFGVVGNYNNLPATSYNSATNQLIDTGIYNATVKTSVQDSLMGIAAGYVDATMKNVLVDNSRLDLDTNLSSTTAYTPSSATKPITTNISDYSLVGYTKKIANIAKDERSIYDINVSNNEFNAAEQSDDQGWGGSINMKAIHERLYGIRSRATSTESFAWRTTKEYLDGESSSSNNSTVNYFKRYHGYNTTGHEYLGNYSFIEYSTQNTVINYIAGGHEEKHIYRSHYLHSGHPITDGLGNYLNFDGTALINGTDFNTCTLWTFTQYDGSVYYISTEYNGVEYRLYNNNNTLSIGSNNLTNANRRWTISEDDDDLIISSNGGKIYYYENVWRLVPMENGTITYYIMRGGNNANNYRYISNTSTSGATPVSTTDSSSAAKFYVDSSNRFYFVNSSGVKLYLALYYYDSFWNGTTIELRAIDELDVENYYYFTYSGSTLSATYSGWWSSTSYYVRFSNNNFTYTDSSNQAVSPTVQTQTVTFTDYFLDNTFDDDIIENRKGTDVHQTADDLLKSAQNSHMYYTYDDTTYFPLNVKSDGGSFNNANALNTAINNGNFDPKDSNTGYIVGGSDYTNLAENLTLSQSNNRNDISKLRISSYPINNISESFTTGNNITLNGSLPDSKIYTFNTSGTDRTMNNEYSLNNYPKYYESRQSFFENSLTTSSTSTSGTTTYSSNSNVYGLHFMNTTINTNSIVNASNVSILGNKCDKYELPANSIDFNLKQKGSVNFFAGTYFENNNSFFSLYQIVRNDDAKPKTNSSGENIDGEYTSFNTINDIKEIVAVYSNDVGTKTTKYSNIYKYKNVSPTGSVSYSYSEPYRFDGNQNRFKMNKNNTTDNETAYSDNYMMSESDFNAYKATYGYTLRLDSPNQLGKRTPNYTQKRIYYFEFPMNAGEYCLGSVEGATGAYLLYLDIGANASKTQRTTIIEHFTITEHHFTYPVGVALRDLDAAVEEGKPRKAVDSIPVGVVVDYSDSACVALVVKTTATKGTFEMDRTVNDVALDRAQAANAPPIYCKDGLTLHEKGSSAALTVVGETHTYDIRRMQYYDFNVNLDSTTVTIFTDTSIDNGAYSRTIVQYVYAGTDTSVDPTYTFTYDPSASIDETESMRVYKTDGGVRYDADDIIDTSIVTIGNVSNDLVLKISLVQEGLNSSYEFTIDLNAAVDSNNTNGTYYIFSNYIIEVVPVGGQVTIRVLTFNSGNAYTADVIYVVTASGNVQITGTSQSPIVITVPTNP